MTIQETIKDILENSLFENDWRSPNGYEVKQNEHLLNSKCEKWGHIGQFEDAWGSSDKLVIDWYGFHLVFETL